jgi:LPXTG-site transpeptidase (sortase) family protein
MRFIHLKKISKPSLPLIILGFIFFIIAVLVLAFALPGRSYSYYVNPPSGAIGIPTNIVIPHINVNAKVESLGLTSEGAMDAPQGPENVAWYNLGTRPGNIGSAVIAGHYGTWKNGQGSVFNNLNKLERGDIIYIKDENGVFVTFVVREIKNYDPLANATDVFYSNDEKSHLNIVTCEGIWNKITKSYSERLVIFADKK